MANLSKQQLEDLLRNKPQGATDIGLITELKKRGYQLEGGIDIPQITPVAQQSSSLLQNIKSIGGFLPKIGGFLGMEKFGKGIGMTIAKPEIEKQQAKTEKVDIGLQENLMQRIKEARTIGDIERVKKLETAGQKFLTREPGIMEEFVKEAPSNKEVIGSAILTGLATLSGGHLSGGPSGFMPSYTSLHPYELTVGGRLSYAWAKGAVYGLGGGLEKNQEASGVVTRMATGAAISTATALIFEGLHSVYNKMKIDPESQNIKAIGARVKDLQKDLYYGNETIGDKMVDMDFKVGNITDVKQQSIGKEQEFGNIIKELISDAYKKEIFLKNPIDPIEDIWHDDRIQELYNAPETTNQERKFMEKLLENLSSDISKNRNIELIDDPNLANDLKIKWAKKVNWGKMPDGYKSFVEDIYRKLSNIMREKIEERIPETIDVNSKWATAHTVHLLSSRMEAQINSAKDIVDMRGWINTLFKKTAGSTAGRLFLANNVAPMQEYARNIAEQFSPSLQNVITRIFTNF